MKKSLKLLFCATALASLAGCNKFDEADTAPDSGNGSLIKVSAKVAENDGPRANIHVGESAFTAEWEAGDALGILPVKTGGTAPATAAKFDYNATSAAFEGSLNDFAAGGGNYYAFFPHAKVTGTTANLPFGNLRTQAGNDFNSAYDALVATPRAYTADDEAGKADGKDVTFTLHRLTSILNFSIATPADKVKYLLLTAGGETQKLSASSLDFGLENGGAETVASLSTTDQSNVIALQYTPDAAGGDHVEAFFNVPADLYPTLTLDVIDSDNQMATVTVDRTEAFEAGPLYKRAVDAPQFASIAPPSLVWPNQDMNEPHDITKCGTDYEANIQITVPGGIAGLMVNITSGVLNEMGRTALDLFSTDLGLPGMTGGVAIQYQKSTIFNITDLIPLIAGLAAPGSEHIFEVVVTDLAGQQTTQNLAFYMPSSSPITYNEDADLWANTASFTLSNIPTDATSVSVQYKKSTETAWQTAEITENNTKAEIKPDWTSFTTPDWATPNATDNTVLPFQRIATGTGVFAENTYDYKLIVDGSEYTGQFTTDAGNTITDGSLESWKNTQQFPGSESGSLTKSYTYNFWGSGYNSFAPNLCTRDETKSGRSGTYCAKLTATYNSLASVPAPGNLFTGDFRISLSPMGGYVSFGKPYTYTARPSAVKFKYHAKIGTIDYNLHSGKIAVGDMDKARVMVCIVDWTAQQQVYAGKNAPSGTWDPEIQTSTNNGAIIGYASKFIEESTQGDEMVEVIVPINYYQQTEQAPKNSYNIVISCSTSAYGDYMDACTSNEMYVDDFEWVYYPTGNIRKARGLYPRPPCDCREVFSCAGYCRGGPSCNTDGRHTARGRMHPVPKKSKKRFEQVCPTGCS